MIYDIEKYIEQVATQHEQCGTRAEFLDGTFRMADGLVKLNNIGNVTVSTGEVSDKFQTAQGVRHQAGIIRGHGGTGYIWCFEPASNTICKHLVVASERLTKCATSNGMSESNGSPKISG